MDTKKIWLITGCSSGFGKALATEVIQAGHLLVATARKKSKLDGLVALNPKNVLAVELDVTKKETIQSAVAKAIEHFGRIDVLVNNAGYGLMGAVEETSDQELFDQMNTNFLGVHTLTKEILPQMRKNGKGHIVNMSSIAGVVGSSGMSAYNASKFALEGWSEALMGEVNSFGIKVTIIEPGLFRTEWSGGSMLTAKNEIADYDNTVRNMHKFLKNAPSYGDPVKAAKIILDIAQMEEPPQRLALGQDAYGYITDKIKLVGEQMESWKETTFSTAEDS